jgi:hypothetical protein
MKGGIRKMFWGKKSAKEETEKLVGPRPIPKVVQNYLVTKSKMDPNFVELLTAVTRKRPNGATASDIRVFDDSEVTVKKMQVKDYSSLDGSPDLILYEGWFDEGSKQVNLEEKRRIDTHTTIFTEAEIQQKIETLTEPGSTVFFYMARGVAHGGPLGMGAAVIELNPNYPGKKQKKYILYLADVVDTKPVDRGEKLFDSDKPKELASWVKERHHKRMLSPKL